MKKSIYVIKNKINNKVYVGQAIDPQHRFIAHLSRAKMNADNSPIHDAIKALGKENFYYEILEKNIEDYNEKEKYWIKKLNCKIPNGYNLTDGGEEPPTFYGENHPRSIISDKTAYDIIDDLKHSKLTQVQIAEKYNVNTQMITSINNGTTHKIDCIDYPIRKGTPYHLLPEEVDNIQWLLLNREFTIKTIAEYFHVSEGTIKHINAGRNYKNSALSYPLKTGRAKGEKEPVSTILAKRSTLTIDT